MLILNVPNDQVLEFKSFEFPTPRIIVLSSKFRMSDNRNAELPNSDVPNYGCSICQCVEVGNKEQRMFEITSSSSQFRNYELGMSEITNSDISNIRVPNSRFPEFGTSKL